MIRKADDCDCPQIYDLICTLEDRTLPSARFREIFLGQLRSEHFCCLVEERDGQVVGVLNLRFEDQLHHAGRIAEILEFAVAPAYRSQGIGKALLEQACAAARENNCAQIEAASNRLREAAHRFYLREGMAASHYKFSKALTGDGEAEGAGGSGADRPGPDGGGLT